MPDYQVRYGVKVRFILKKFRKRVFRQYKEIFHRDILIGHHVFHPRDLHFCKNSPNRRKYCFSFSRNSLFRCLRSQAESCFIQYVVILNVSDMSTEIFPEGFLVFVVGKGMVDPLRAVGKQGLALQFRPWQRGPDQGFP